MDRIQELVDHVIANFDARRRKGWSPTGPSLTGPGQDLARWGPLVEARLHTYRNWQVDRQALLDRARRRFDGGEWSADLAGVADELQEMAREDLERHLTDNGVPAESARRVARGYSIGAMLRDGG